MQISTWVSSQKLRLISATVRVNMQFLCCWRLRNQHELDAVIEELSALLSKEQLYRLYEQATREPYSFLFVYYLKPKNEMFYKRFEERFALERLRWGQRSASWARSCSPAPLFFPFYSARRCLAAAPGPGRSRDPAPCTSDIYRGNKQEEETKGAKSKPRKQTTPRKERPLWGKAPGNLLADQVSVHQDP